MAEPALHVGVDARELLGHPTGVGRYLREILTAWSQDPTWPHRVTLFAPAPPTSAPDLGAAFGWTIIPAASGSTYWEQTRLPPAIRRAGCDVFLGPGYSVPVGSRCPSVVLLHDVSFFAHPEWFNRREGLRRRLLARAAAKRARVVGTLTEFSAGEIERWLGVPRSRIVIAPPGAPARDPDAAGPRAPVVLFVGSIFTRRRIPDLLRGFVEARRQAPGARLVLVGENRTHPRLDLPALLRDLGLAAHVEWRPYEQDAGLTALYRAARVFAFLSDYEGFAMTPLEAIAHGAPAVLLDTPVAREVYGASAALVPPDAAAIGAALARLLVDDAAHDALLERGRALLSRYQWTTSANTLRQAIARAAGTSPEAASAS